MDASALKNIKIKVGESFEYNIPIGGEPQPTASWTRGNVSLRQDGRIVIKSDRATANIKVQDAQRSDSGKYTLTLKNSAGEQSGSGIVTVVCKLSVSIACLPSGKLSEFEMLKHTVWSKTGANRIIKESVGSHHKSSSYQPTFCIGITISQFYGNSLVSTFQANHLNQEPR